MRTLTVFTLFLKSLKNDDGTATWAVRALAESRTLLAARSADPAIPPRSPFQISSVNLIPIGGGAINIVIVWSFGFISDHYQRACANLLLPSQTFETGLD